MERLRIGIDLDNTLIDYERVFVASAIAAGVVGDDFRGCRKELRDIVRGSADGERQWMGLQGLVYGAHIAEASLYEGAAAFLENCRTAGCRVYIVSHKTEFGHFDPNRINLRDAASRWMEANGFFDTDGFSIPRGNVYFAATREEKCCRIAELDPDHFIDDLPEVFLDPSFPDTVKKHLFQPTGENARAAWAEIENDIFRPA